VPGVQFYSTAAQIIPVLFLALIVERRFFEPPDQAIDPLADLLVVLVFIAGEAIALAVLGGATAGRATMALTATPLAIGGLALVAPITGPRLARLRREAGSGRLPAFVDLAVYQLIRTSFYGIPLGLTIALWLRSFM
jgi:hypothetical protein